MNTDRLIAFTQDLVRLPSLSGEEQHVAARVQAEMTALGFDRVWQDANGSVVGVIEGARPGKTVLLDYELQQRGINPRRIQGYDRTEYTHLAVAAAVKSGAADAGLGILAAARALDLDFVPLFDERYDLVIPVAHYTSALLQPLLALIRDRASGFAAAVEALGGYGTAQMGVVLGEY